MAQGLSDKEAAAVLGLSEHTIHRHISNVLNKLDVPSRAAAVAQAAQRGLLRARPCPSIGWPKQAMPCRAALAETWEAITPGPGAPSRCEVHHRGRWRQW